jgi:hypothetical protein
VTYAAGGQLAELTKTMDTKTYSSCQLVMALLDAKIKTQEIHKLVALHAPKYHTKT